MDIGSEFDDDFFENPKGKEGKKPSNYEAKVCLPLWYMAGKESEKEVMVHALKHQADMHYFSKNYSKAVETYEKCLKMVPSSNTTWKREFMENLSRSCLHLEDDNKALEWALKLHETSFSIDQKTVSLNLLAIVCHKLGKYKEELEALHFCLQAHKHYPDFWMRLGLCYAGLFKINLPGSTLKPVAEEDGPCCAFNSKSVSQSSGEQVGDLPVTSEACAIDTSSSSSTQSSDTCSKEDFKCETCTLGVQIVSSCLIHTRLLMDSNGSNLLDSERDVNVKEKIAACLDYMQVDQSFIDIASSELGTDFITGLQNSDNSKAEQSERVINTPKEGKE